jgi:hypothetical protein
VLSGDTVAYVPGLKMKQVCYEIELYCREARLDFEIDRSSTVRFHHRPNMRSILAAAALCLICSGAFGQTTRTSPSAASTIKSIPAASSTSANNPCSNTNPTSPCYSANAPRNPCYSAAAPEQPCSTTVTPSSPSSTDTTGYSASLPAESATAARHSTERAMTADQAKSQIAAEGYSKVSGLQKDAKGIWRGKAMKDGSPTNVTIGVDGKITAD